jgi:hypothetical protein
LHRKEKKKTNPKEDQTKERQNGPTDGLKENQTGRRIKAGVKDQMDSRRIKKPTRRISGK